MTVKWKFMGQQTAVQRWAKLEDHLDRLSKISVCCGEAISKKEIILIPWESMGGNVQEY